MNNPNDRLFLGIDTSAYTTSLALVGEDESLVMDERRPLAVPAGKPGLRQSEAVFEHLRNLALFKFNAKREAVLDRICAAAVAIKPRPLEGSYLPVFKVSEALGVFITETLGLKYYPLTHQEGHIMAGMWAAGLAKKFFIAVHLSGGTNDILFVKAEPPGSLEIETISSAADLYAGQFIDRIGLALGLPFPAGPELEKLASKGTTGRIRLSSAVKGRVMSFSGPLSQAERLLSDGVDKADLARAVELCIAESLLKALKGLFEERQCADLLLVGGVSANMFIQRALTTSLPERSIHLTLPRYASDNAVGLAVLAARRYREEGFAAGCGEEL